MSNVIEFPDNPDNVAALEAMTDAVYAGKKIGFDREKFLKAAASVWDGVEEFDKLEEQTKG